MSTLDTAVLSEIQYVVIEPPNSGASYPSGLWTVAEVLDYLNDRQNDFLKRTTIRRTRATLVTVPNQPRQILPNDWIVTLRVGWQDATGTVTALSRGDMLEMDMADQGWDYQPTPMPFCWTDGELPTRQIQLAPAGSDNGVIRLLYVACGTLLTGAGVALTVPDLCAPGIKYGVLADMLRKPGRAFDPVRAAYCEARYEQTIEAAALLLRSFA